MSDRFLCFISQELKRFIQRVIWWSDQEDFMWKILREIEKYQLNSKTGYDGGYYIKQRTNSWQGAYDNTIENTGKGADQEHYLCPQLSIF